MVLPIDCKKDGWRVSASFHYRKVKWIHLSRAAAILSKWHHLEPESVQKRLILSQSLNAPRFIASN